MAKAKPGRPKSRANNLETFTAHLSPEAKARLTAASQTLGEPMYQLLEKAFWDFWEALPKEDRKVAETIAKLTESRRRAREG